LQQESNKVLLKFDETYLYGCKHDR
jgi:hypothetical protein